MKNSMDGVFQSIPREGRRVDKVPDSIMEEVLARLATILE